MTAAVVGHGLDWVGILACLATLIGAAGRMALTHTRRTVAPWVTETVILAMIGTGVLVPATLPGVPAWMAVTAAAAVLVGFPLLLVYSSRRWARHLRDVDRAAAARAAEAAAGLGAASHAGAVSDVGGGW